MSDCRIVYNENTGLYRVERRGWMGWTFIMDEKRQDYATFDSYEDARRFACETLRRRATRDHRRWKVVDFCRDPGPRTSGSSGGPNDPLDLSSA